MKFNSIQSMWNTAVGIKISKQVFSKISIETVAFILIVPDRIRERSCLKFLISTGPGINGKEGVLHSFEGIEGLRAITG